MVPTKHGILLLHMNIFEEDLAATTTHVIIMGSDSTLKIQPPSKLPRLVFILVADIGSRLRSKYADPWIPSSSSFLLIELLWMLAYQVLTGEQRLDQKFRTSPHDEIDLSETTLPSFQWPGSAPVNLTLTLINLLRMKRNSRQKSSSALPQKIILPFLFSASSSWESSFPPALLRFEVIEKALDFEYSEFLGDGYSTERDHFEGSEIITSRAQNDPTASVSFQIRV
ncbi:hypothetical protein VNO77_18939 [Canavalia gladiata]|uniref:Uncharacterized protein n=1 Tax=Canavalia gladiata TaxID=3824 RepID=A0AAN9LRN2_CANGL